jgi:transcription factor C subunit 3
VPSVWVRINHLQSGRRVGIPQTTEKQVAVIAVSIEQIEEHYEIIEREQVAPNWDYIWNTTIEEGREKKLKRQPFSQISDKFSPSILDSNETSIAESAVKVGAEMFLFLGSYSRKVKMVMGSPLEHYDSEQASFLLRSCGDEMIKYATKNLLSQGVLSKLQRDPKKLRPGRLLKISEAYVYLSLSS